MSKTFVLILLLFLAIEVNAQTTGMPSGLDGGKYTPKGNSTKKKNSSRSSELEGDNFIGLSAAHLIRQMAVLTYERNLNDRFAIKVSGGYCFGKDLSRSILAVESSGNSADTVRGVDEYNQDNEFLSGVNYYGDVTGKVYTNVNEADFYDLMYRFYAGLSYRNFRQTFKLLPSDIVPSGVKDLPVTTSAISLVIGQMLYRESGATVEYYLGIGRQSSTCNQFRRTQTNYDYIYDTKKVTESKVLITIGVVYGLVF